MNKNEVQDIKIIQLKEDSSNSNTTNYSKGSFAVNLSNQITLNDGDALSLKSAFIDVGQSASNGTIKILSDDELSKSGQDLSPLATVPLSDVETTISIKFGYYVMDYYNSYPAPVAGNPTPSKVYSVATPALQNTGDPFVLLNSEAPIAQVVLLSSFEIEYVPSNPRWAQDRSFKGQFVEAAAQVYYTIPTANGVGDNVKKSIEIFRYGLNRKELDIGTTKFSRYDADSDKYFLLINQKSLQTWGNKSSFQYSADGTLKLQANIVDDEYIVVGSSDLVVFNKIVVNVVVSAGGGSSPSTNLVYGTHKFTIPSKDYEPSELASVISTKFEEASEPNNTDPFDMSSNVLLTNTQKLKTQLGGQPFFCNLAGTQNFQFIDTVDALPIGYNIGSSQFGLTFDETSQKFELNSIHTSRYNDDGDNVIQGFLNANNDKKIMNKYSGVFITEFHPSNLWIGDSEEITDCMKFSNTIITKTIQTNTTINGVAKSFELPTSLIDSVNITGDLSTLDSFILKKNDITRKIHYDNVSKFVNYPTEDDVVGQVNSIFSKFTLDPEKQGNLGGGYFLVEIDMGISNEFRSGSILNSKINGIVSRYYNNSNFVSGGEESGIMYIHKGTPIDISRLKVRILTPDGDLSEELSNGSTIFLQVITKK